MQRYNVEYWILFKCIFLEIFSWPKSLFLRNQRSNISSDLNFPQPEGFWHHHQNPIWAFCTNLPIETKMENRGNWGILNPQVFLTITKDSTAEENDSHVITLKEDDVIDLIGRTLIVGPTDYLWYRVHRKPTKSVCLHLKDSIQRSTISEKKNTKKYVQWGSPTRAIYDLALGPWAQGKTKKQKKLVRRICCYNGLKH